ncbi:MAG TPA: LD-carboxypeptidase [Bacteroidota bacterium]|nr:LD-carboxypeptidase [Bacteroidota bacterium]
METIKAIRLQKGDTIGIVAPASRVTSEDKVYKGVEYLERLGYRVKLGKHIFDLYGYCAGRDEDRAADFNEMILDKTVKAIFTVRGGYGSLRILPQINYLALRRNPKIIVGYSDITALQLAIYRKTGLVTFSGPMIGVEMWNEIDPFTEDQFWRMVTSAKKIGVIPNPDNEPLTILRSGKAEGKLFAGNLSLLVSLMGTSFFPSLRNAILAIEDVDEAPHRIDRMLAQLLNGKILANLSALIYGTFVSCEADDEQEPHLTLEQVQKDYAEKVKSVVVGNLRYGHMPRKVTLPIGVHSTVDTKKEIIRIDESCVL